MLILYLPCKPHISINKITEPHYDFLGSDGPIDCLTNRDILTMFKEKTLMDIKEFTMFVENTVDSNAVEGGFKLSEFTNVPVWDDTSFWVVETILEDEIESKIIELEKQNAEMLELAKYIQTEIIRVNETCNKLV